MPELNIQIVDAFTTRQFSGNQAAVVVLDAWLAPELMQSIASENNLSETAFVVRNAAGIHEIRWFSPLKEIDFCGHATLASAFVIFAADPALEGGDGGPVEEDEAFEVELAHSGRVISVHADQTVVEALGAEGIEILTSCGEGVCGTCLTRVIAGEPDHRDQYLTPEEQAACDQFLPCCSRAKSSRLVLDL